MTKQNFEKKIVELHNPSEQDITMMLNRYETNGWQFDLLSRIEGTNIVYLNFIRLV